MRLRHPSQSTSLSDLFPLSLSLDRVLKQLQREGYDVGMLPMDDTALIKTVLNQTDAKYNSAELNIAYRMKVGARGRHRRGPSSAFKLHGLSVPVSSFLCHHSLELSTGTRHAPYYCLPPPYCSVLLTLTPYNCPTSTDPYPLQLPPKGRRVPEAVRVL